MSNFDFIVVGGGPSGSSLASRLSCAPGEPSVLLIEGGTSNEDPSLRVAGERNTFWATGGLKIDRGYVTEPQEALEQRKLPYHRGTGLGGSSATNIGVWDYGCKPDMNEWAKRVGDNWWAWENVQARFRELETFHDLTPAIYERYVRPDAEFRGKSGPVDVTYPSTWDPCLPRIFEAIEAHGLPLNFNISSDKGIGMGVAPATVVNNSRVTASSAYLTTHRKNLHIMTESTVQRVIFEGKLAKGVELIGGQLLYASREIILCAGAIDTPKILLLSGVGPAKDLAKLGIPTILDQPGIGRELQDHPMIRIGATVKENGISEAPLSGSPADSAGAAQGYLKLDSNSLPSMRDLEPQMQSYLKDPLLPTHELLLRIMPSPLQKGRLLWVAVLVLMNTQSCGSVTLRSKDPHDAPVIDLKLLTHPYDMQVAREAIRSAIPLMRESGVIPTDGLPVGPKSLEDTDVDKYIRATATHLWHACGTVKMGRLGEKGACVTPDFKVQGLSGLRVADLSVTPLIPSHHTQSTAYLIGERAAELIIAEL